MRLYSFISNEKNSSVRKGGNKGIDISLHHETKEGSWETNYEKIDIALRWAEGKPFLRMFLPDSWELDPVDNPRIIRAYFKGKKTL